jgi:hypothetical protein
LNEEKEKQPKWDDPEESARFIETAERIQDEHAGERFEEAMKRLAKAKRQSTIHGAIEQDHS